MRGPTAEQLVESIRPAGLVVARFGADEDEIAAYGGLERDARVEIGSVTKLFTARLLTLLVEEGTVRLDEPAAACLGPGWRLGGHVTLERLACHRAGLPRLPRRAWRSMLRDGDNPYRTLTVDDLRASLPPWLPRARWFRYSNFGAALLGHALAARTGVSWADLIADRITAPLNMNHTGVGGPVAQPHSRTGSGVDADGDRGAGALRSTASDLIVFVRSERSWLGWARDGAAWWHNGGTGGSASFVGWHAPRGSGVVLLANTAIPGPLTRLALRLLDP